MCLCVSQCVYPNISVSYKIIIVSEPYNSPFWEKSNGRRIQLIPNIYILVLGGYIPVLGGYILLPGGYFPVTCGYSSLPGGYIPVLCSFIPVPGGYIPVLGGFPSGLYFGSRRLYFGSKRIY
jgi:hypothetical protein